MSDLGDLLEALRGDLSKRQSRRRCVPGCSGHRVRQRVGHHRSRLREVSRSPLAASTGV